jgi:hypothetical protein
VRIFTESGFLDPNKPIRKYTKTELHDFLHREPTKVKVNGVNLTYEGLIPKVRPSTRSWRSGWATSRSTGRRGRCRAARRSAPR